MIKVITAKCTSVLKRDSRVADGLDELDRLLAQHDRAELPIYDTIDKKAQDLASYFAIAYAETGDFDQSMRVYRTVKALVRYIVLMDRYYEVGNSQYQQLARDVLDSIKRTHQGHLKYSIDFALKQAWPFWSFERKTKAQVDQGVPFSQAELRHFNLFKSSDAPIIYSRVLDSELQSFNPNIASILHCNQALLDIHDDLEDIEEDVREGMPSIFIMAATRHIPIAKLRENPAQARKLILSSWASDAVCAIVEQHCHRIEGLSVPPCYEFLKRLSRDYSNRIYAAVGMLPRTRALSPAIAAAR